MADASAAPASGRYGVRGGSGDWESDRAADGSQAGICGGRERSSVSARAAESIPAYAERDRLQAGPGRSGRLRTLDGKVRERLVREFTGIGGRSGVGAHADGGNPEA